MATPFLDDFTEASNTNLEDHTPSGGTAWTLGGGVTGAALVQGTNNALRTRSTTASYYTHDDQGSANQYVQARLKNLSAAYPDSYVCCRLVDASNFVGWRCFGTGSSGLRLCESVSGTVTDKYTFQGVDESVYKVEVDGTTARIYEDGVQKGTDQTVGSSTETSHGVRIGSDATVDWVDEYEAGALGGGATTVALNPTSETDAAHGITSAKVRLLGQANETDSAEAITAPSAITAAVLQASETDTAQAVASLKRAATGQASETDSAQAITPARRVAVGQASETDSAQAAASIKRLAVNPASETDSANAVNVPGVLTIAVGQVTEAEFAQAIAAYKRLGVLQPVEADSAHAITARKVVSVGQAAETGIALAIALEGVVGVTDGVYAVQPETRIYAVQPETRIYAVQPETRIHIVTRN